MRDTPPRALTSLPAATYYISRTSSPLDVLNPPCADPRLDRTGSPPSHMCPLARSRVARVRPTYALHVRAVPRRSTQKCIAVALLIGGLLSLSTLAAVGQDLVKVTDLVDYTQYFRPGLLIGAIISCAGCCAMCAACCPLCCASSNDWESSGALYCCAALTALLAALVDAIAIILLLGRELTCQNRPPFARCVHFPYI